MEVILGLHVAAASLTAFLLAYQHATEPRLECAARARVDGESEREGPRPAENRFYQLPDRRRVFQPPQV